MCELPHISFNFVVELSHLILCDFHIMLTCHIMKLQASLFSFISYITLMLCRLPHLFASLFGGTLKYPVWLHYFCVNVTHVRFHFFCVNVTQISLCIHYFLVDTPLCILLFHNWPILVLILCGLPHLISQEKTPFVLPLFWFSW